MGPFHGERRGRRRAGGSGAGEAWQVRLGRLQAQDGQLLEGALHYRPHVPRQIHQLFVADLEPNREQDKDRHDQDCGPDLRALDLPLGPRRRLVRLLQFRARLVVRGDGLERGSALLCAGRRS